MIAKEEVRSKPEGKIYFENLDALRFFAFFSVFFSHTFDRVFKPLLGKGFWSDHILNALLFGGETGVQFFFVLSGFLITYLLLVERKKAGNVNVPLFYVRRSLRIWPLYMMVAAFAFLLLPIVRSKLGLNNPMCAKPVYFFTFLANFDIIRALTECPHIGARYITVLWSVAVEEQFYLVWPLLFFFVPKRFTALSIIFVIAASVLYRIAHMHEHFVLYFHTFSVMGDLAIGGLGAYYTYKRPSFRQLLERMPRAGWACFYIAVSGMYLFAQDGPWIWWPVIIRPLMDVVWCLLILDQVFSKHTLFQAGKLRFAQFWGNYTFGLYMLHSIALFFVEVAFKQVKIPTDTQASFIIIGIITFGLSLLMAWLSYHLFELPFLKLKKRFAVVQTK